MKNKLTLVLLLFIAVASFSYRPSPAPQTKSKQKPSPSELKGEWRRVDSLAKKGLDRSALEVVMKIYNRARDENNASELVKAVIHRMKFQNQVEEDAIKKIISDLEKDCVRTRFPANAVLHSMLAESYWSFYQQNRWRFLERTETTGSPSEDINTWDLKKILEVTVHHYKQSLKNADSLKKIPVTVFDGILVKGNTDESRKLRPTLYDFLAHRAVDYYMTEEPGLTRPADGFKIDAAWYLNDVDMFLNFGLPPADTTDLKFHAILLLQNLIRFHSNDEHPGALIDVNLKRLKFVHEELTLPVKDSIYLLVLQKISDRYRDFPGSTDALYEMASQYLGKGNSYKTGDPDEIRLMKKKAELVCDTAIARFPYSQGGLNCKHLKSEINEKLLSFQLEKVQLPGKPFLGRVSFANISRVYMRVVRLEGNESEAQGLYGERLIKHYLSLPAVKEWDVELPDDKDRQSHSAELKFSALPLGKYVMLVSTSPDFTYEKNAVAYAIGWVSNISYFNRKTGNGSQDLYVTHRETGLPMANVTATVYFSQYNYQSRKYEMKKGETAVSDAEGRLNLSGDEKQRSFDVEFRMGDDRLFLKDNFYPGHSEPRQRAVTSTFFFTDRAIYRPGQTVFFKGITIDTDGETSTVKAGMETTVQLFDVNSEKISEISLKTNEYGTFNGTFTAPQGVLTGQMRIQNETGSRYFSVEEYKRPKFEVTFSPVQGAFRLDEKVTVKGKADSYAGAPVSDAAVKYRVVRKARIPEWIYYWRSYMPPVAEVEILNGTVRTDASGQFTILFDAQPDRALSPELEPVFIFQVTAFVTDVNGETRNNSMDLGISYRSLFLESDVNEKTNREDFKSFLIRSRNNSGIFEPARGKVTIHRLEQPSRLLRKRMWEQSDRHTMTEPAFVKDFPFDVYNNENQVSEWKKAESVVSEDFDTGRDSVIETESSSWKPGNYILEIQSADRDGKPVLYKRFFTLYSEKETGCPVHAFAWFTPVRDKGEPGTSARFLIGSADQNVQVLFEVEWKNKIVSHQWLVVSNEQKLVEVPIEEKHRGNFSVHFSFVKQNRFYHFDNLVTVPWSNKDITISTETFRDKLLPGAKEIWLLKLGGKFADKIAAEMLVSMYDASLDAFVPNRWSFHAWNSHSTRMGLQASGGFGFLTSASFAKDWNTILPTGFRTYDELNWFGSEPGWGGRREYKMSMNAAAPVAAQDMEGNGKAEDRKQKEEPGTYSWDTGEGTGAAKAFDSVFGGNTVETKPADPVRANFSETAFFFPDLRTSDKNEIVFSFTMPDALTRWKMMGFAHTKELEFGFIEKQVITQKDLMVTPNAPRFFREGDTLVFPAKITNLSDSDIRGNATLTFFDALSGMNVTSGLLTGDSVAEYSVMQNGNAAVSWKIHIPAGTGAVKYRVTARSGNFSDGEEQVIPVLTNRQLVTESMPLSLKSKQTKSFTFEKLKNTSSPTLQHHKLTLEFTSNPAWYAIQSLPYLMEYPYECSEQIFSRYYSNALASHIVNSSWRIKGVFDLWKLQSPESFLSGLEKNQELKSVILQQTPWVLQAKDDSDRKKRVALLFELNRMSSELQTALLKLQKKQLPNGAWAWFDGLPDDRYITQYIVEGFGHLDHLNVKSVRKDDQTWQMVSKAIHYLDDRIKEDYQHLIEMKADLNKNNLNSIQIHYLYARSFFTDVALNKDCQKGVDYFVQQSQKFWLDNNEFMQGMISLSLSRRNEKESAADICRSLKERSLYSEELGRYWKNNSGGFYWTQASIETQSLLVETFLEVTSDKPAVEEMQQWLIKNKQTNDWGTTKATAEACYALLLQGTDFLAQTSLADITIGGEKVKPFSNPDTKPEAGTGYFKTSWSAEMIKPAMGELKVENKNEGPAWGAIYWQYFEDLDKITPHETPLKLSKKIFVEQSSPTGPVITPVSSQVPLKVGDRLKVRIELRVDRDMEYVMMNDLRASGLEPENVLSSYKFRDGLYYYESTHDASTDFFFSSLPKGTYVFEYPLRASQAGVFSNGLANIQCMYAPEFGAHSEGINIEIKQ